MLLELLLNGAHLPRYRLVLSVVESIRHISASLTCEKSFDYDALLPKQRLDGDQIASGVLSREQRALLVNAVVGVFDVSVECMHLQRRRKCCAVVAQCRGNERPSAERW